MRDPYPPRDRRAREPQHARGGPEDGWPLWFKLWGAAVALVAFFGSALAVWALTQGVGLAQAYVEAQGVRSDRVNWICSKPVNGHTTTSIEIGGETLPVWHTVRDCAQWSRL